MGTINHGRILKALEKVIAEKGQEFIWNFLAAYGMSKTTLKMARKEQAENGDVIIAHNIYYHHLRPGENPEESLAEIRDNPLMARKKIQFILIFDGENLIARDCLVDDRIDFSIADLPANYEFFLPLTGQYKKPLAWVEHPADIKACEKMARLYEGIKKVNNIDNPHNLNIFLTRLLFCFYAEDTGIFPEPDQMTKALLATTKADGSDTAEFFEKLFHVLDLPDDSPEREKFSNVLRDFPYVNGRLFQDVCEIPGFDKKTRQLLLDCGKLTWNEVSPVIFGAMFQSIMDQELRRQLGAHYTSEKNIMKVIRPLFLDGLYEEFEKIRVLSNSRNTGLKNFQKKLASLGFMDPACGCGNFLIVAYREIRKLEILVLSEILKEKGRVKTERQWLMPEMEPERQLELELKFEEVANLSTISIDHFYGIEIEEFPVEIARVSMWLMEHMMNLELGKVFGRTVPTIPLKNSVNIVAANALEIPWEEVAPAVKIDFILGNPPFAGARRMDKTQKKDLVKLFKTKGAGELDYVAAWYKKAADYMAANRAIAAAFVSTNSITQGQQVGYLWKPLLEAGIEIIFCHTTFKWQNEASGNAAIFCVVIGFKYGPCDCEKRIISERGEIAVRNISPYLNEGSSIVIKEEAHPASGIRNMQIGSQFIDDGNLILSDEERDKLVSRYPYTERFIKKYVGAKDYINNNRRYCLWLYDFKTEEFMRCAEIRERAQKVKLFREKSKRKSTIKAAKFPYLCGDARLAKIPDQQLIIPRVSSERRKYIPIGYVGNDTVIADSCHIVPNADFYDFAILTSAMHMAWMRATCGRLEMRYRYSRDLCYNTFPWPKVGEKEREEIARLGLEVLKTRERHPDMTLAQMYDPEKMPEVLRISHENLDGAVDMLYSQTPFSSDEERLGILFKLYEKSHGEKNGRKGGKGK